MKQEIKDKYNLIMNKPEFKERLSVKLGVTYNSVHQYFCKVDNVPIKHEKRTLNALNKQIERDRITKELTVKDWEEI